MLSRKVMATVSLDCAQWQSVMVAVAGALCIVPPLTSAFNLDVSGSYVLRDPTPGQLRESYFGYSIALYSSGGSHAWSVSFSL